MTITVHDSCVKRIANAVISAYGAVGPDIEVGHPGEVLGGEVSRDCLHESSRSSAIPLLRRHLVATAGMKVKPFHDEVVSIVNGKSVTGNFLPGHESVRPHGRIPRVGTETRTMDEMTRNTA